MAIRELYWVDVWSTAWDSIEVQVTWREGGAVVGKKLGVELPNIGEIDSLVGVEIVGFSSSA